jgi:hypothetical protein
MEHQHIFSKVAVLLILTFIGGCTRSPEKTPSEKVREVLADSSSRAMLEQRISDDHEMYLEELHLMIEQGRVDTLMGAALCSAVVADSVIHLRLVSLF